MSWGGFTSKMSSVLEDAQKSAEVAAARAAEVAAKAEAVMAATPGQLAIESAEKAGLHKVSETLQRMEAADPLGLNAPTKSNLPAETSTPAPASDSNWASFGDAFGQANAFGEVLAAAPSAPATPAAAAAARERADELEAKVEQLQQQLKEEASTAALLREDSEVLREQLRTGAHGELEPKPASLTSSTANSMPKAVPPASSNPRQSLEKS